MKLKHIAASALLAAVSFGASAAQIISAPVVGDSFSNVKIGTITIDSLSDLSGSLFATESITFIPGFTLSLDKVTFSSGTVGSLVDLDGTPANFSFHNVAAGSYDVIVSGTLAATGAYHNLAVLGANYTVTAVPEPTTYAMLLGGLGLVGAIARRKAKKAA